jgi:hypothetical protein
MRLKYMLFLVLFGGLLITTAISLGHVSLPPDGNRVKEVETGEVWGERTVGQTFVASYPGLYRIDIFLDTSDHTDTYDATFHLREGPQAANDLYSAHFDPGGVEDDAYHTFAFDPIRDSAGRTFYFFLSASQAEQGDAFVLWKSREDTYPGGQAYINGAPLEGDLVFLTYYEPPWFYRLITLLDRLAANKPGPWGDKTLYILLFGAYLVLAGLLFRQLSIADQPL